MSELTSLTAPETEVLVSEWPRAVRWTVEQYETLWEAGVFEGQRVELIEGEIVEMSPMNTPHWSGVGMMMHALGRQLPEGYFVRESAPFVAGLNSIPLPDVSVYPGASKDYTQKMPVTVCLLVEVSDSTLAFDRGKKLRMYAHVGVVEYWILNLRDKQLEVFRDPEVDHQGRGFYGTRLILIAGQSVSPLFAPSITVHVDDVVPHLQ